MANGNRNDDGIQVVVDDTLNNNGNTTNTTENEMEVEIEDSFQDNSTEDSNNDNSNNSVNNEDSNNDNSDNSTEDSYNDNRDNSTNNEDSFNDYSDNLDVDVDNEDSFNDNSDHDHSVRTQDSFNITSTFNTQTLNDSSTTIGVRQYQAGFGDFNVDVAGAVGKHGAAGKFGSAGKSGDLDIDIDNRSIQVDQSVSQGVSTSVGDGGSGGNVAQMFGQNATIAAGDGSNAAGGDVIIDNSRFNLDVGDVAIGNTDISTRIADSFNDQSTNYDLELEVEFEDSFNYESNRTDVEVDIEDSFTSEVDAAFENSWEWENSGNMFSPVSASNGGEAEVDL